MRSPAHPLRFSGPSIQCFAWCTIALGLAAGCTKDPSLPPSEKQLTTMLVQAASLDQEEMRGKLRAGAGCPCPGWMDDQRFSCMLFYRFDPDTPEKAREYTSLFPPGPPDPANILWFPDGPLPRFSYLKPEDRTEFTYQQISPTEITGIWGQRTEKFHQFRVHFRVTLDKTWKVTEFSLPAYGLRTRPVGYWRITADKTSPFRSWFEENDVLFTCPEAEAYARKSYAEHLRNKGRANSVE
jgi:hypothetical protein